MRLLKEKKFWGLVLAVGLLIYCFYDFDFHEVLAAITAIKIKYLIPLLFLESIIVLIRTTRLKIIFDPVKNVKLTVLYPTYNIGMMANLLMPYLTGQVARLYLISKKAGLKKAFVFTTTVLEVLFDGLALFATVILISVFVVLPAEFKAWHFGLLGGVIVISSLLLFILSRSHGLTHRIFEKIIDRFPERARKKIEDIRYSFFSGLEFLRSTKHLFVVSLLSILSWLMQAIMVYLLILAFRFPIGVMEAVIITVVVTILMTVVLAPWNIGTFQGATVATMQPFGISKPEALAFSLLLHIFVYLPPIMLGAFFAFKEGLTLKQLRDEGEKRVEEIDIVSVTREDGEFIKTHE
ncbi:MAG: lysylphosphatidylglycerol synthase transmembrane domain-containing protein [candidate division Zixibacteria bacterium]